MRHNSVALDGFAEAVEVMNHPGLWEYQACQILSKYNSPNLFQWLDVAYWPLTEPSCFSCVNKKTTMHGCKQLQMEAVHGVDNEKHIGIGNDGNEGVCVCMCVCVCVCMDYNCVSLCVDVLVVFSVYTAHLSSNIHTLDTYTSTHNNMQL